MLRQILGAVAGYIAMFICIFLVYTCAYLAMGTEAAFQPGNYQVSMTWIIVSLVLAFVCALAGGYIASLIGGQGAVKIAAVIALAMGIIGLIIIASSPALTEARGADVPNLTAMSKAQTPVWAAVLNPLVIIAGIFVGGRFRKAPR